MYFGWEKNAKHTRERQLPVIWFLGVTLEFAYNMQCLLSYLKDQPNPLISVISSATAKPLYALVT